MVKAIYKSKIYLFFFNKKKFAWLFLNTWNSISLFIALIQLNLESLFLYGDDYVTGGAHFLNGHLNA